jgi:hypothetical protein
LEFNIISAVDGFIELDQSISSVTNRTNTSVTLALNPQGKSHKIYSNVNIKALKNKNIDHSLGQHFHFYHHGIVPHELTGFSNITRIAPGLNYDMENKSFRYIGERPQDLFWTSDNEDAVESFKYKLSESVTNSDADAILFSGGIDSLLLAILDKSKRPLFHFNNDPIQKMIASALAMYLDRPLEIVEPEKFDVSDLQLALKLRKNNLGHYLPWNNGATFSKKTFNKKLISGQHADTLLMVDTFAPGINSHGLYWYARMFSSANKRAAHTLKFLGNANDKVKMLNKTINSYNEHVELSASGQQNLSPLDNKTVKALVENEIYGHSEFVKYAKLIKDYRFCINANRIYSDVERVTGYERELIYYQPEIRMDLINYLPGVKDCFNPKHLFYNIVKEYGIDYYTFKKKLLNPIINSRYFITRLLQKQKHHQSEIALQHIKWNASELGLDFHDLLVDINMDRFESYKKSDLMILDRKLNYLQYVS